VKETERFDGPLRIRVSTGTEKIEGAWRHMKKGTLQHVSVKDFEADSDRYILVCQWRARLGVEDAFSSLGNELRRARGLVEQAPALDWLLDL